MKYKKDNKLLNTKNVRRKTNSAASDIRISTMDVRGGPGRGGANVKIPGAGRGKKRVN